MWRVSSSKHSRVSCSCCCNEEKEKREEVILAVISCIIRSLISCGFLSIPLKITQQCCTTWHAAGMGLMWLYKTFKAPSPCYQFMALCWTLEWPPLSFSSIPPYLAWSLRIMILLQAWEVFQVLFSVRWLSKAQLCNLLWAPATNCVILVAGES